MGKRELIWNEELEGASFYDSRLRKRAILLLNRIFAEPESSINQSCLNWAETKAAYRFFRNDKIGISQILAPHIKRTVERTKDYKRILAIQDTTKLSYNQHKATQGLRVITRHGKDQILGLTLHTVFAVTLDGLPLGILDQQFYYLQNKLKGKKRSTEVAEEEKESKSSIFNNNKESLKWIHGLINSKYQLKDSGCQPITVCDREGDVYDLFEHAHILKSPILVRAKFDRKIRGAMFNSARPPYEKEPKKLRNFMKSRKPQGRIAVEIPSRGGDLGNNPRTADLEVRFSRIMLLPPLGHIRRSRAHKLTTYAVYVSEPNPPEGETPLDWMLLTNISVQNYDEAAEKVIWYSLRFRIETLHRILKSGFLVENCRLSTAEALARYISLMSVASWKIFWLTILGRVKANTPCTLFLTEPEWKVLYSKIYQTNIYPKNPITTRKAIHLMARLGGYLDRKHDAEPGVITLWRGWRRLNDLAEGWNIAKAA